MVHELNTLTVQVSKTESFAHPSWNVAELVGSIQFIGSMRLRERETETLLSSLLSFWLPYQGEQDFSIKPPATESTMLSQDLK